MRFARRAGLAGARRHPDGLRSVLDPDQAALDELRDGHLAADAPDLHLADELIQDGFDHAHAGRRGGVGVELDRYDRARGGLSLRQG